MVGLVWFGLLSGEGLAGGGSRGIGGSSLSLLIIKYYYIQY